MRFLRFSELKAVKGIPYSRMHINRLEKAGLFPKRVRLSSMTVAWVEEEVDAHLASKIAERKTPAVA